MSINLLLHLSKKIYLSFINVTRQNMYTLYKTL